MGFASGVNKVVVIAKESTWGTKPAPAGGTLYPRKTLDLNLTRASFKSERINSTAQVSDLRSGTDSVTGTLAEELSAGSHTDLWASLLRGPWTTGATYTASTISIDGTAGKFVRASGSWITDGYKAGDLVVVTGATLPENNVRAIVKSLTATDLVVDANLTTAAASDSITVAVGGKKLIIPQTVSARTDDSFTVEQWFNDISVSRVATGVKVGQAAVKIQPDAMATVDFTLTGKDMISSATRYFTNPAAPVENSLLAGNKGTIYIDGAAIAVITGVDFTVNGNIEAGKTVGNLQLDGTRPVAALFLGMIDVSGTITAYFLDDTLFTRFRDDVTASIVFRLSGDDNKEMVMKIPAARLTSATPSDSQTGGLTQTVAFTALLDTTPASGLEASTIVLQEILA